MQEKLISTAYRYVLLCRIQHRLHGTNVTLSRCPPAILTLTNHFPRAYKHSGCQLAFSAVEEALPILSVDTTKDPLLILLFALVNCVCRTKICLFFPCGLVLQSVGCSKEYYNFDGSCTTPQWQWLTTINIK
jgi:hypothetical protein